MLHRLREDQLPASAIDAVTVSPNYFCKAYDPLITPNERQTRT
jgi:hypothetical protein